MKKTLHTLGGMLFGLGVALSASASSMILSPASQMQMGRQSMDRHMWQDAIDHFHQVISVNFGDADAHASLGYAYFYAGKLDAAATEFRIALKLHPHLSHAENGLHLTFKNETEHDAYVQSLRDQVAAEPGNANAHAALAEELLEHGHPDDAAAEANKALQLDAAMGHADCVLGRIAASQGNAAVARGYLETAIKRDINDDDAWATLGDLSMQDKDYDQAVKQYEHAIKASPADVAWHDKLAEADTSAGDAAGAVREHEASARLSALASGGD